jgi:hypothetical protein
MNVDDWEEPLDPLASFNRKAGILRDHVRMVASGKTTGCYIYGPAGTGKTHNVETTLDENDSPRHYCNGHMTPIGLFDGLAKHHDKIVVIDDIAGMFTNPQSLGILLAALGCQPGGERLIKYQTARDIRAVYFTGGVVMLSNLNLRSVPIHQALMSRIGCVAFDPDEKEIEAFLRYLYRDGCGENDLDAGECQMVIDHVLMECQRYSRRLDLRTIKKALPFYALWKSGDTETDWRDFVSSGIKGVADQISLPAGGLGRAERVEHETEIARRLQAAYPDRQARAAAWEAETGKSERALYRRLK